MYAIIKTGGKQYRVKNDDIIDVELLGVELGAKVEFNEVLFVQNDSEALVGKPSVSGYVVKGKVVGDSVGPKVVSLKYKPRQHQQKKWGHRQHYTRIKILEIGGGAKPKAETKSKVEPKPKTKAETMPKAETKPKTAPKRKVSKKEDK